MGHVTNLILCCSSLSQENENRITKYLNNAIRTQFGKYIGSPMEVVLNEAGGDKYLETTIYCAAFSSRNGWTLEKFLDAVRSVRWDYPDELQLFVKGEDDDRFTEVVIFPPSTQTDTT